MAGLGVFLFGVLPVAIIIGVASALVAGRNRAHRLVFDESVYPGLAALRGNTINLRWMGIVAGIIAGLALIPLGAGAPLAFASPLVAGIVVVVAIVVGQQLSYARARGQGTAGLETRRVRDYVPRRLARWVGVAVVVLLGVCGFTTIAASPDDLGRPGRALAAAWVEHQLVADENGVLQPTDVLHSGSGSPFPGSFYMPAVLVALAVLLVVAAAGLVLTARRPRNGADPELVRVDDALRRITAEGIVAATGAGVAGAVLAVTAIAYPRLGGFPEVPLYVASSYLLGAVALGALALTLAFAVVLIVPGSGTRR